MTTAIEKNIAAAEGVKGFGVTKELFSECIKTLITDAQAVLHDKLLYSRPAVDLSSLTDDCNNMFTSFVDRESNNLQPFTRITDIGENYCQRAGSPSVSPNKVAYRKNLEIFLEYVILLFLLTGALPDQSPMIRANSDDPLREVPAELIVLKHRAQPGPGKPIITRAIFIDDSHMVCITTPDMLDPAGKGWRMRFLPDEVSKMVVLYLACVLPFYRTLAPKDAYSTSDFIFAHQSGGIWHTARFERALKRETEARMGVGMDINAVNSLIQKVSGPLWAQN